MLCLPDDTAGAIRMDKFLVFTDLHITEPDIRIIGLDPLARLSAALEHALARHGDAAGILLLGDLTHHGRPEQYSRLAELLREVPLPVHATLGNHDQATAFAAVFPQQVDGLGFAQHALEVGGGQIILLDTNDRDGKAPKHGGWLCEERLTWLDRCLAQGKGPVLLACHHPPFMTGFPGMDAIALANGAELLERLRSSGRKVHLLCGHVHRTISGMAEGMGFTVLKSPCHQMPMDLEATTTALSVDEPGAYGIVLAGPDGFVIHSEDVLGASQATLDPGSA